MNTSAKGYGYTSAKDCNYITDRGVGARYKVSRPTVWRWVRIGHLPPPEAIGPNTKRWRVATLDAWDDQRETEQQTIAQ